MTSRGDSFCGQSGRGLHAEIAPSALRATFKLVVGGLTNILLVVLGIVNLQLQGLFVNISLWSVHGIVAAHIMATVWSSCK